ncbi:DUF1636 family protein [Pseudoruegeria sp. HB172150]|uniref:DUF1636 family protein n=1 Tax=Pseudoruegeria sp. HB172150 TaxID=2721164 RepID=UPI001553C068|nr:DUF1636 family protein [Pseudoruegeria sp. HB172150]
MVRLTICAGCSGGDALADVLREALPEAEIARADCLSVCTDPATVAAQAEGRATYVFSGVGIADEADIRAFLAEYAAAPKGWIEDARPLGRLRFCLVTRVPAIP